MTKQRATFDIVDNKLEVFNILLIYQCIQFLKLKMDQLNKP